MFPRALCLRAIDQPIIVLRRSQPMKTLQNIRRLARAHLVAAASLIAYCSPTTAGAADSVDPRLIFYAPFEESTDAVIAGGNPKPLRSIAKLEEGRVGKGARSSGGSYQRLAYDGRGNI